MYATIIFSNGAEITTQSNGNCFITDIKPEFPDDLSVVMIDEQSTQTVFKNAELIECASIDNRYWFAFRELSIEEIRQKELEDTIQMLTDGILEISETVYA